MTKAELEAKLVDVMETCERLGRERDEARAAIDRVRALCDLWEREAHHPHNKRPQQVVAQMAAHALRAALDPEEGSP